MSKGGLIMRRAVVLLGGGLLFSCGVAVKQVDPTAFTPETDAAENIPQVCKASYETSILKVAVVNFTNNTTFDYASLVQASIAGSSQRTTVGGAAVGVVPGAAGIVWGEQEQRKFQTDAQAIQRQVNAKLSESVEDGVTEQLFSMGVRVYTRSDLDKVLQEQKFQRSGLVDEKSMVALGKLIGVNYIVTGSITNVDLKWVSLESLKSGLQQHAGLFGALAAAAAEQQEGWNVETKINLRIIDVQTGEIVFSKGVSGKHIIGKVPYPNYDALIGGIKKAAERAILDIRPELSKWFPLRGYIIQTRVSPDGKQKVALVSLGSKNGVKEDTELLVYTFQEISDPMSGKASCDKVKLNVTLKPTNQIQEDRGWFMVEGEPNQLKRVKAKQLVERAPLKGQGILQKLGH